MTRTRLWSNFLKDRSEESKRKYSKRRNYLLCITTIKLQSFGNLNEKNQRYLAKISSRRDVFKTSPRRLAKKSSRRLQNVFKTSCEMSSRHLQDVLQRCLQDFFKTYQHVKLFLLTSLRQVFNTFLRHTAKTMIYRMIGLGHTSEKFMVSVQNLKDW